MSENQTRAGAEALAAPGEPGAALYSKNEGALSQPALPSAKRLSTRPERDVRKAIRDAAALNLCDATSDGVDQEGRASTCDATAMPTKTSMTEPKLRPA